MSNKIVPKVKVEGAYRVVADYDDAQNSTGQKEHVVWSPKRGARKPRRNRMKHIIHEKDLSERHGHVCCRFTLPIIPSAEPIQD